MEIDITTLARAEMGDVGVYVGLGLSYFQQGDNCSAEKWWLKGAEAGKKGAVRNLVVLYSMPDSQMKSAAHYFVQLKELAYRHKDPWGMLHLGIILAGGQSEHRLWLDSFRPRSITDEIDPVEGFRLIELAIESMDTNYSETKLNANDYEAIASAYKDRYRAAKRGSTLHGRIDPEDLDRALKYTKKCFNAIPDDPQHNEYRELTGLHIVLMVEEDSSVRKQAIERIEELTGRRFLR